VIRRTAEVRLDVLLRTACTVIAERGLANTRTADVAAAAGVSQALVFYHFHTKHQLLARAFEYAAVQDLGRVDAVVRSPAGPVEKIRKILRLYMPGGSTSKAWELWLDGWAQSLRVPELERVTRGLDLRWHDALRTAIADGVAAGVLDCADPGAAAWRIIGLADGLAIQVTVHERLVSRRQLGEWVRMCAAQELGLKPDQLA
jgi:AcrR family transcriptional regulator